jgi:hypothetical protein
MIFISNSTIQEKEWQERTLRGLKSWRRAMSSPKTRQAPPATMKTMPSHGFLPPTNAVVEMTMDFVPA